MLDSHFPGTSCVRLSEKGAAGFARTRVQQSGSVQIGRRPSEQYVEADVLSGLVLAPYRPSVSFSP